MPNVEENKAQGTVSIDGHRISGFVDDELCATCGARRMYYDDFDAYFCAACNVWLESACPDPECARCQSRPGTPLPRDGRHA